MCVKLSLTLREVHRLGVLRIFEPRKGEMTERWVGLLNDQLKEVEMGRVCSMNREKMNTDTIPVGRPNGSETTRQTKT
jgi:hypothetical protein